MKDSVVGVGRLAAVFRVMFFGVIVACAALFVLSEDREARAHDGEHHDHSGGFQIAPVLDGLTEPTSVEFSSDGRIYVAEKSGIIKVFDGTDDDEPAIFADLRSQVHSYYDRGLIGLTLHPDFPGDPRIYALYTHDAPPGGQAPEWNDCERAEDQASDECIVSTRLSALTANTDKLQGEEMIGQEKVLLEGWCQKYTSHSAGHVAFGADGALYVSGGDGADFNKVDHGQDDGASCGDPALEGGALRAQDPRTTGDPTGLNGALIRVNPDTGDALPDNPRYTAPDDNASRIVAYGFRNPFRFAVKPGTSEVWQGDVGWSKWEEINRVPVSRKSGSSFGAVPNFGWPCYEGAYRQAGYDQADVPVCENLYNEKPSAVTEPYVAWRHCEPVFALNTCNAGEVSSSMSGLDFYTGDAYPSEYRGALFFADGPRGKLWMMPEGSDGVPDADHVETILDDTDGYVVEVQNGPGGELYMVQFYSGDDYGPGRVVRLTRGPAAEIRTDRVSGDSPLTVSFDGTGSSDPQGQNLSYEWDLDADGEFDDSTSATPNFTFEGSENRTVQLRVVNADGQTATASVTIYPDNSPPRPTVRFLGLLLRNASGEITGNASAEGWAVGDEIGFNGYAQDSEDTDTIESTEGGQNIRIIPTDRIIWDAAIYHCYATEDCHRHPLNSFGAGSGGGGIINAPDHGHPAYLEFTMTATDSRGMQSSVTVRRNPRTVNLAFASEPSGVNLTVGDTGAAPFEREVIVGSTNSVSAPKTFIRNGVTYEFRCWSDGNCENSRDVIAPEADRTYTARYVPDNVPETGITSGPAGIVASRSATFSFEATPKGSTFECSLDGAAYARCITPKRYTSLKDGTHIFRVRAKGSNGTTDATPATRTWLVDTIRPAVSLVSPKGGVVGRGGSVRVKVSDAGSGVSEQKITVHLDGVERDFDFDRESGIVTVGSAGVVPGWRTLRVRATDAAGNVTATSWRLQFAR